MQGGLTTTTAPWMLAWLTKETPSKIPIGKKSKVATEKVSNLTILEANQNMEKNFDQQLELEKHNEHLSKKNKEVKE